MRKKLKILIVLFILIVLCFLVYKVVHKIQHKNKISETLQTIPEFSFQTLDGNSYSNKDIKQELHTIFIYFNSECDYCQHEALSIKENITLFKDTQFIFVSSENKENILKFSTDYKLSSYESVIFLQDTQDLFSEHFEANSIPYILVYDKNQNLIKRHNGQLDSTILLKILENAANK